MPPLSLYLSMCLKSLSQTREPALACANPALGACNGPIGSNGAMICGRRCPIHGERAKPLDRAAAAAHVGCCVCCVLKTVVLFVWEQLLAILHTILWIFNIASAKAIIYYVISLLVRSWGPLIRVSAQTRICEQIDEFASPNFPTNFTHHFTNFKFASDLTNLKVAHQS